MDAAVSELRLSLPPETRQKLLEHYRLLVQWNQRVALTTIRDPREIAQRHFAESLFVAARIPEGVQTILDVGSGPGFPGLPIAAFRPDIQVTAVESVQRKAVFLREASRNWGNVGVRNERIEALEGQWDASVMRAVAVREVLPELARLSRRCGLLVGEEGVEEARGSALFHWNDPIPTPWGERRYLLWGQQVPLP
ncbi:MAG: 16S rRNA (guanine(527)-N(7))-methyltransferase RsmG [Acidobacteria bacterium]|nr:16S rRNA (guanine(527)-N(7))-methyltransferase RsmG [Acidobacteriota bacterium]